MTGRAVLASLLGVALWGAQVAAGGQIEKRINIVVPDYGDAAAGDEALDKQTEEVLRAHRELIGNLLGQLMYRKLSNASQVYIVYALGELRAVDPGVTTYLILNINLVAEKTDPATKIARWSRYPARDALVKLGPYASGMVMDIIGSHKFNPESVDGYAYVIAGVEGPKYALMKLRDRAAKAKNDETRKRYEAVIASIEAMRLPRD